MPDNFDQELLDGERNYSDFFDSNDKYVKLINDLILERKRRLIIDLNDLREFNENLVENLLKDSVNEVSRCQNALKWSIASINPEYSNKHEEFFVGFEGSFGSRQLNPRSLTSEYLGNMVCVEGIVTKVVKNAHYCPSNNTLERQYVLETAFGFSLYKDCQTITVQEMIQIPTANQLLRSVDVVLDNDLVHICKAGNRIYVSGQFLPIFEKKAGFTTAKLSTILIANHVYSITNQANALIDNSDLVVIREMAKQSNILELLTKSIAPTIYGHELIKRAVLCQLLGGVERVLVNESRIRGDINILLLGDPCVGKTAILQFVLQCARDRAIATNGRGFSGIGLTAAIMTDSTTGERSILNGPMVLADRGIVCIDEFHQISCNDCIAIQEVMEQGEVIINKGGIEYRLNARCSVLAAAQPVHGRYIENETSMYNIGMPDTMLSRFDLVFIMLDKPDEEKDRQIAEFVCRLYPCSPDVEYDGHALLLEPQDEYFSADFFQKYIQVARQINPKLSKKASTIIYDKYCDLRRHAIEQSQNGANIVNIDLTQPGTDRTMWTLIRLATAHAKARMNEEVTEHDANDAAELISHVIFTSHTTN